MIGTGILKGMAVTARNFVGSYFEKDRLITVQYPEERNPLPENYRNFPFLIYDKRNVRRSASISSRAKTRSPTTWASRSFIRRCSTSTSLFA